MSFEIVSKSLTAAAAAVDPDHDADAAEHGTDNNENDKPCGDAVLRAVAGPVVAVLEAVAAEALNILCAHFTVASAIIGIFHAYVAAAPSSQG